MYPSRVEEFTAEFLKTLIDLYGEEKELGRRQTQKVNA